MPAQSSPEALLLASIDKLISDTPLLAQQKEELEKLDQKNFQTRLQNNKDTQAQIILLLSRLLSRIKVLLTISNVLKLKATAEELNELVTKKLPGVLGKSDKYNFSIWDAYLDVIRDTIAQVECQDHDTYALAQNLCSFTTEFSAGAENFIKTSKLVRFFTNETERQQIIGLINTIIPKAKDSLQEKMTAYENTILSEERLELHEQKKQANSLLNLNQDLEQIKILIKQKEDQIKHTEEFTINLTAKISQLKLQDRNPLLSECFDFQAVLRKQLASIHEQERALINASQERRQEIIAELKEKADRLKAETERRKKYLEELDQVLGNEIVLDYDIEQSELEEKSDDSVEVSSNSAAQINAHHSHSHSEVQTASQNESSESDSPTLSSTMKAKPLNTPSNTQEVKAQETPSSQPAKKTFFQKLGLKKQNSTPPQSASNTRITAIAASPRMNNAILSPTSDEKSKLVSFKSSNKEESASLSKSRNPFQSLKKVLTSGEKSKSKKSKSKPQSTTPTPIEQSAAAKAFPLLDLTTRKITKKLANYKQIPQIQYQSIVDELQIFLMEDQATLHHELDKIPHDLNDFKTQLDQTHHQIKTANNELNKENPDLDMVQQGKIARHTAYNNIKKLQESFKNIQENFKVFQDNVKSYKEKYPEMDYDKMGIHGFELLFSHIKQSIDDAIAPINQSIQSLNQKTKAMLVNRANTIIETTRHNMVNNHKQGLQDYWSARAKRYKTRDSISDAACTLFSCFGYKTEKMQRADYLYRLHIALDHYRNSDTAENHTAVNGLIAEGLQKFSPHTSEKKKDYNQTLQFRLKALQKSFEAPVAASAPRLS